MANCKKPQLVGINEDGHAIGEWHPSAVLSDAEVEVMRDLHENHGWGYWRLAQKFGISKSAARDICLYRHRAQTVAGFKER